MTNKRNPAEVFPVGEYLADELDERDWSHTDLAERTGLSPGEVADIVSGRKRLLVKDAEAIGRAFGTSPETWLRLQKIARKNA